MIPEINPIKGYPNKMIDKIDLMIKEVDKNFSTVNALNIKKAMLNTIIEKLQLCGKRLDVRFYDASGNMFTHHWL